MSPRALRPPLAVALSVLVCLVATAPAAGHEEAEHPAPVFAAQTPPAPTFVAGGPGASWRLLTTIAVGNPLTDLDFFTQGGETYLSVGTLAFGPNAGGQTIVQLTDGEGVSPQLVSSHPSASCISDFSAALGLQHDAEATPKEDAQLVLDATDNEGRCHDGGDSAGWDVPDRDPQGGLEIIDVTDVAHPVEIGLTSHIGEAHTVNVDPKRPHIAFAVSSDAVSVTCNADDTVCARANENPASTQRFNLDGFELVDLSTCMSFPPLTSVDVKRTLCRPEVYRYRWESPHWALGHSLDTLAGCHELEIYPDDRLACASIAATLLFDLSGAFDDNGTPTDYTDDRPRGTPLPCSVRDSSSLAPYATRAQVTDCVFQGPGQELTIPRWLDIGAPSLEGVRFLGAAIHQGRPGTGALPPYDSKEDVEVSHEAELTESGRFLLVTDERGGGVVPPNASCLTSPADNVFGNGGLHAYRPDRLLLGSPTGDDAAAAATAHESYARTPDGGKAVYRAPIRTQPQADLCGAHVFHLIPGQNRIFMAWYSQGTQVVDFVERADGTIEFREAGFFIPTNANQWVSAVFKVRENADGTYTYWGATGDFNLGTAGRNAVDVYEVTLPAPPRPFAGPTQAAAKGAGWLQRTDGRKLNFALSAELQSSGPTGSLQLRDAAAGASVDVTTITSLGAVGSPCGGIEDGPSSVQLRGRGTFNGAAATFVACVADGGRGSGAVDRFHLECMSGCAYTTAAHVADNAIDGGNITVRRGGETPGDGGTGAATVMLQPLLLSQPLGATQVFSIQVYDANQEPLAGAEVQLTRTSAGDVETLTGLTDATGVAAIVALTVGESAEYVATVDGVQSNAVELAPLGG